MLITDDLHNLLSSLSLVFSDDKCAQSRPQTHTSPRRLGKRPGAGSAIGDVPRIALWGGSHERA